MFGCETNLDGVEEEQIKRKKKRVLCSCYFKVVPYQTHIQKIS